MAIWRGSLAVTLPADLRVRAEHNRCANLVQFFRLWATADILHRRKMIGSRPMTRFTLNACFGPGFLVTGVQASYMTSGAVLHKVVGRRRPFFSGRVGLPGLI